MNPTASLETLISRHSEINRILGALNEERTKLQEAQGKLLAELGTMEKDKITRQMGEIQLRITLIPDRIAQLENERHALYSATLGQIVYAKRNFLNLIAAKRRQTVERIERVLLPFYHDDSKEVKNVVARLDPPTLKTISKAWNRVQSYLVSPEPTPQIVETAQQLLTMLKSIGSELEMA